MWNKNTDPSLSPVSLNANKCHSSECMVSVIMHCRGRPDIFHIALRSLSSSCSDISAVEILVKVDSDDPTASRYLEILTAFPFQNKFLVYDRLDAWWSVHVFETDLSRLANGKVLWLFNEDNAIVHGDWLRAFRESRNVYPDNIYVCAVPGMRPKTGKIVAPAYSCEWFNVMQLVSPHVFSDRFLIRVAGGVNRLLSTPLLTGIDFTHRAKEKVARPSADLTKAQLTQILEGEINRCVPIFRSAIAAAPKVVPNLPKIYPPGTKVGPGYTEPKV